MTEAVAGRGTDHVLAYLDPASWAVGGQLAAGAAAWAWLRFRRIWRRLGFSRRPRQPAGVEAVAPLAAAELLAERSEKPRLVFIVEGPRDWPYLAAVAAALMQDGLDIWCVSNGDAPRAGLIALNAGVRSVADPGPAVWGLILSRLQADAVVTTLTDLDTTQFPKSPHAYYAYVFHSPVSTHVAYSTGAFDGFDAVFCPGERHARELVIRDQATGRAARTIAAAGYPFLDDLCQALADAPAIVGASRIVLAPSWSSDELLTGLWLEVAGHLCAAGWQVTFRPHAETIKRSRTAIEAMARHFASGIGFEIDLGVTAGRGFAMYDAMVTDWSGAGIEFALSGRGPVAFIETPRKVRNPYWQEISPDSVEALTRAALGPVVPMSDLRSLSARLTRPGGPAFGATRAAADAWTVNHGTAAAVIAAALRPRLEAAG